MQVLETIEQVRNYRQALHGKLALVPTMGALHEGHLSLIRQAGELADHVAVSLFVNPTQFGPNEDFDHYPRPAQRDLQLCQDSGTDMVFYPQANEIYPPDEIPLQIDIPKLTNDLEGANRPGHFEGVCRVVAKLFGIVLPDIACFGQKDYQQLAVIEALTKGLCLPVKIKRCATVREEDGLAMSSRNAYLKPADRHSALGLISALREGRQLIAAGETDPKMVEQQMLKIMTSRNVATDYAVVRHCNTLLPVEKVDVPVVLLVAGRIGQVRLIDNEVLD